MRSHQCQFRTPDLVRILFSPLLFLGLFSCLMQMSNRMNWLPAPWPVLDMDRTVLTSKVQAAREHHSAQLLLLGDSSCLMGVSAADLMQETGLETYNLATLSYVDLEAHGLLLKKWVNTNPDQVKIVVLLLHPEALRRTEPSDYHQRFIADLMQERDPVRGSGGMAQFEQIVGLNAFRNRILARLLPVPLPGEYGKYYGFTTDLYDFLARERGSAVDPNHFDQATARGNAEYRLARGIEAQSILFRKALPPGVQLAVGLTPSPVSFVTPQHATTSRDMLLPWSAWLKAEMVLTNLPATMPDACFASTTHLNATGRSIFTRLLAEALAQSSKNTP